MKKRVNRSRVRVLLEEFNRYPEIIIQYLESSVCFTFPELIDPIDKGEFHCMFSYEGLSEAEGDFRSFIIRAGNKLGDCDLEEVAHKFLMSRNGIPGFWNHYPKVLADKLDRICRRFPKVSVKRNTEGLFYYVQTR
jgi:hypothetical protein